MLTVSIIGPGRVGGAIALSLPKEKYEIKSLIGRHRTGLAPDTDDVIPISEFVEIESVTRLDPDILFITTQDAYIADAAERAALKIVGKPIVFHTSGSNSSTILNNLRSIGCSVGSIHPLVSISRPEFGPERFRGSYFCVEGEPIAVRAGNEIVQDLGGIPFTIDTKFKTLYHAAAVTACGHLVALFDAAVEMMSKCGLAAERSKEILLPLVTSTVQNLAAQSTPAALTGTFARADIETFTRHLNTLNENVSDELLEIYLLLGERSLELAAKQGVSSERIESLRTKVSIAKSKLKW